MSYLHFLSRHFAPSSLSDAAHDQRDGGDHAGQGAQGGGGGGGREAGPAAQDLTTRFARMFFSSNLVSGHVQNPRRPVFRTPYLINYT